MVQDKTTKSIVKVESDQTNIELQFQAIDEGVKTADTHTNKPSTDASIVVVKVRTRWRLNSFLPMQGSCP